MTREEAKDPLLFGFYLQHKNKSGVKEFQRLIDKIYDDFENNTEDECIVFSDERGYIGEHGWAGKVKPNAKYKLLLIEEK